MLTLIKALLGIADKPQIPVVSASRMARTLEKPADKKARREWMGDDPQRFVAGS